MFFLTTFIYELLKTKKHDINMTHWQFFMKYQNLFFCVSYSESLKFKSQQKSCMNEFINTAVTSFLQQ